MWDDSAVFVMELPWISIQLRPVPLPKNEVVDAVRYMLKVHNVADACFMGHSYGTIPVSWCVQELGAIVSSSILLDPVSLVAFYFLSHIHHLSFSLTK